ncbi:MAG: 16S rRNA (adenine(1518)-N(6)/adenine(1519)-N(6))-dimethyltransferase RsmA [Chlorobiota bacterium]
MDKLKHKKSLGQNFLIDESVSQKIAEAPNINKNDSVIEIGPGTGALTKYLLELTDNLVCIEIDQRAVKVLKNKFPGLNIINIDILKQNMDELLEDNKNAKIIGNLPYYISTQIIFKLLEHADKIDSFTFMIQKELADRIVSPPNSREYGILTLAIMMCGTAVKLFDVPPEAFDPPPKVTSSVVKIDFNKGEFDYKLHQFIKASFNNRRKKLSNSIKSYFNSKEDYKQFVDDPSLDVNIKEMLNLRAENLSLEDFRVLYNSVNSRNIG